MAKLAPTPAKPVDMVSAERQQDSQVLPQTAPIDARLPTMNLVDERRTILQRLNDTTHSPLHTPRPPRITTENTLSEKHGALTPTDRAATPPPPDATSSISQTTTASEVKAPGFFATLKSTLLRAVGLGKSKAKDEPQAGVREDHKPGLLTRLKEQLSKLGSVTTISGLISWGKGLACAIFPSFTFIIKPLSISPAEPCQDRQHQSSTSTESYVFSQEGTGGLTHRREPLLLSNSSTPKVDFTAQGLASIAQAKREETAKENERKDLQQDLRDRDKAKIRSALTKVAADGVNKGDLSAIIAELEGVYGSAEVALRQVTELVAKKKVS